MTKPIRGEHCSIKEVFPNVWLGSLSAVQIVCSESSPDVDWTVISLLDSPRLVAFSESLLKDRVEKGTCRHIIWNLADKPGASFLSDRLKQVLAIMDEASDDETKNTICIHKNDTNKACLVHCAKGVSRSVSVCAAWYISRKSSTLSEALDMIRKSRPEAMPNIGFLAALRALEQSQGDVDKAMDRMSSNTSTGQTKN
jgi:protein-tyrosine phosphatase